MDRVDPAGPEGIAAQSWAQRLLWIGAGCLISATVLSSAGWVKNGPATMAPERVSPLKPDRDETLEGPATTEVTTPESPRWTGVIVPKHSSEISATAEGRLAAVAVRVGDRVQAGQVLARLDRRPIEDELQIELESLGRSEAELERRRFGVDRAEREQNRRQRLADVLSREHVERAAFLKQEAEAELKAAEAELRRIRARVQRLESSLELTAIRAPYSGTIAHRYFDSGTLLQAGAPVLRLISHGAKVRFAVPPDPARALKPGDRLRLRMEPSGRTWGAVLESRSPEIDAPSQMIFVEAGFDQDLLISESLSPGSVVRVSVSMDGSQGAGLRPGP